MGALFPLDATKHNPRPEAILLVDDDDLQVRATTRLLRGLGYPFVFRAASAADARQMLERFRPSLVLTDMVMEHRAAGCEVIAACRLHGIRVAVVSGSPGLEEEDLGCRICRKANLSGAALERLIAELMAEIPVRLAGAATVAPVQRAG